MADPLSVTADILAIVQVVLQGTLQTKQFINGIQGAPRVVQSLPKISMLYTLYWAFFEATWTMPNQMLHLQILYLCLSAPLENCISAFENISKIIKPFVNISGVSKESQ